MRELIQRGVPTAQNTDPSAEVVAFCASCMSCMLYIQELRQVASLQRIVLLVLGTHDALWGQFGCKLSP